MPFEDAPPLPDFIAEQLPLSRRAFVLEDGEDAGRRVHLIDDGPRDAAPVVMVHGNPTWSFLWRKVIAALPAGKYRCIAPDLLGLGLSDRLPTMADHQLDRHVDALLALIAALELPPLILVGQDWGGPIAAGIGARLTEADPHAVAGVVFGNTSVIAPKRPRGTFFHRLSRIPVLSEILFVGGSLPVRGMSLAQGDRRSIRGEVARAYRWPLRSLADRKTPLALARMVPDRVEHPSLPGLRRGQAFVEGFSGPLAWVWGTRDPILARALPRHARLRPDAPVTVTPAGHFLQEEVPDALAEAIDDVAARAAGD